MSANTPMGQPARRGAERALRVFGVSKEGHSGPMPPLGGWATHTMYVRDDEVTRVFSMQDDGGFVGVGYPDEWHVIMRWGTARMFAWWVLRHWVRDWFGLRSALYFRALNAEVNGSWGRLGPPRRKRGTRRSSYDEWLRDNPRSAR